MMQYRSTQLLTEYSEAIHRTMESILQRVDPPILREALLHAVRGGKMVRPQLVCLACSAAGGSWKSALGSSAAVEFLHASSLIHDDIMDNAPLRRGKPTLHMLYEVPFAILAGDALVALAFDTLLESDGPYAERRLRVLTNAFRQLCQGQALDLIQVTEMENPAERVRRTAEGKTAALFRAAAELGALHVTDAPEVVVPLSEFGFAIGMAFQGQDDLLDAVGLQEVMGKPVHQDHRNRRVGSLASDMSVNTIQRVRGDVHRYTLTALEALRLLPQSPARDTLESLAHSLEERES